MEYADITGETWSEIHYLAKRKQPHPEPEITGAAYNWAADFEPNPRARGCRPG